MPELVEPTVGLRGAWLEAHLEWGPGYHEDGFGIRATDDVVTPEGFGSSVARLTAHDRGPGVTVYRWIVDGDRVLGGIVLRHGHPREDEVGHIGFGLRASARGRGVATWALGEMLCVARDLGLKTLLLMCLDDNVASARTIEHHGGVLEGVRTTDHGPVRRYRISL